MICLKIKPLSVNEAWKGRRYKSDKYKAYFKQVYYSLPKDVIIPSGPLSIEFEFGFSNSGSDWDNAIKQLQDILQARYGFNDSRIVEAHVRKIIVKKGEEYFKFLIDKAK